MKLWTIGRVTLLLLALAPVSGCRLGEPDIWAQRTRELEHNRQLWHAAGTASYRFLELRTCYCPSASFGLVEITVDADTIVGVRSLRDGNAVPANVWPAFQTVASLFATLDDAIARRAYRYEVVYDPVRGFPASISLDGRLQVADDELYVQVSSLSMLE